jgi:hypothetical protein
MSAAVVAYESASLNDRMKYAQTLAAAGDLIPRGLWGPPENGRPPAPSPGKVLLVMETGAMLGLMPAAALQSIDVVEGRATLSARLMGALIRKAGHKLEIVKTGTIPGGDYSVTVTGTRSDDGSVFTATWDIPRAIRAGLVDSYQENQRGQWEVRARSDKGKVKPWEAYAELMPVWRAMSEVGREGFADVLFGLYSTEEMTDGGIPIAEPAPEPTEDWLALIKVADSEAALAEVGARLAEKGEGTDQIRAAYRARAAVLSAEANTVDAEVVSDAETPVEGEGAHPSAPHTSPSTGPAEPTAEEFEAAERARYDAAVAAGEVTGD